MPQYASYSLKATRPLALLWAFLAFEKRVLESEISTTNISVAQCLLPLLKFVTARFCNGPTAFAAAAPIVQVLISAIKAANPRQTKKLLKFFFKLSGYISLCHHKAAPVTHGLFKAPSVNIWLNISLSEESDFGLFFPFAAQLKVDEFLYSIESVLFLGETIEIEVALLRLVVDIIHGGASEKKHNSSINQAFIGNNPPTPSVLLQYCFDHCTKDESASLHQEHVVWNGVTHEKV